MKNNLRVGIGLLIGAAAIAYILFRVDAATIWSAIRTADVPLLALAAAVATTIFPLRAIRWKVILLPVDRTIGLGLLWRATAIGFGLNNVLAARLGEFARAYTLTREAPRVGFPAAFASIAVDRLFDAAVVVGLLMLGLLGLPAAASADARIGVQQAMLIASLATLILFSTLFVLAFFPALFITAFKKVVTPVSPRLSAFGADLLSSFAAGLSVLKTPFHFVVVLFWTVVHWMVNALAFWIGFKALGVEAGYLAALATQGVIALAVAAPQAPGFLGVFQFSGALALGLYGVDPVTAYAWAFAYWAASFIPITVIGVSYFARLGISLAELREVLARVRGAGTRDPSTGSTG